MTEGRDRPDDYENRERVICELSRMIAEWESSDELTTEFAERVYGVVAKSLSGPVQTT